MRHPPDDRGHAAAACEKSAREHANQPPLAQLLLLELLLQLALLHFDARHRTQGQLGRRRLRIDCPPCRGIAILFGDRRRRRRELRLTSVRAPRASGTGCDPHRCALVELPRRHLRRERCRPVQARVRRPHLLSLDRLRRCQRVQRARDRATLQSGDRRVGIFERHTQPHCLYLRVGGRSCRRSRRLQHVEHRLDIVNDLLNDELQLALALERAQRVEARSIVLREPRLDLVSVVHIAANHRLGRRHERHGAVGLRPIDRLAYELDRNFERLRGVGHVVLAHELHVLHSSTAHDLVETHLRARLADAAITPARLGAAREGVAANIVGFLELDSVSLLPPPCWDTSSLLHTPSSLRLPLLVVERGHGRILKPERLAVLDHLLEQAVLAVDVGEQRRLHLVEQIH